MNTKEKIEKIEKILQSPRTTDNMRKSLEKNLKILKAELSNEKKVIVPKKKPVVTKKITNVPKEKDPIKNLSELKSFLKGSKGGKIWVGVLRGIKQGNTVAEKLEERILSTVQSNSFATTTKEGRESWIDYGKASDWKFGVNYAASVLDWVAVIYFFEKPTENEYKDLILELAGIKETKYPPTKTIDGTKMSLGLITKPKTMMDVEVQGAIYMDEEGDEIAAFAGVDLLFATGVKAEALLQEYFETKNWSWISDSMKYNYDAWLEEQEEEDPKRKPKFKVGDYVTDPIEGVSEVVEVDVFPKDVEIAYRIRPVSGNTLIEQGESELKAAKKPEPAAKSDQSVSSETSSQKEQKKFFEKQVDSKISECKKALEDAKYSVTKKRTASGTKVIKTVRQDRTILKDKMDSVFKTIQKDIPKENKDVVAKLSIISEKLKGIIQSIDKLVQANDIEKLNKIEAMLKSL